MTDLRQAAQQALEALAIADNIALVGAAYTPKSIDLGLQKIRDSATALRAALEQQAEPVCPECKAAVLYECVACSSNNYPPKQQAEPVAREVERWQWIFEDRHGDRYTHKNLFYTADEAAESARICGVKAIKKIDSSKVMQQAEPVAYYHPHKGFYWAKPTYISAPIVVDVPPVPLYVKWKAAQRPWQGLTDEDVNRESAPIAQQMKLAFHAGMYAAQKILKEKNSD